jgi:hypothetical protein
MIRQSVQSLDLAANAGKAAPAQEAPCEVTTKITTAEDIETVKSNKITAVWHVEKTITEEKIRMAKSQTFDRIIMFEIIITKVEAVKKLTADQIHTLTGVVVEITMEPAVAGGPSGVATESGTRNGNIKSAKTIVRTITPTLLRRRRQKMYKKMKM